MKTLRILGIVILSIWIVAALVVGAIFGVRAYNAKRFPILESAPQTSQEYPTNDSVQAIEGDYLNGFHFTPAQRKHPGVVITYGGSEGSPAYGQAQQLAEEGYEVLALYFFGQPNQQPTLANVPLDHFDEVVTYIRANVDQPEPITAIGTSKGAELVALLAAHGYAVDNIVAFAPADHSYSGLDFSGRVEKPSFTHRGEPVPFASFRESGAGFGMFWDMLLNRPPSYRASYVGAAEAAGDKGRIDMSAYPGNALFFAGEEDAMWQSEIAARALEQQSPRFEAHLYPGAGHMFSANIEDFGNGWQRMFGGTAEGAAHAAADSRDILLQRLSEWHGTL